MSEAPRSPSEALSGPPAPVDVSRLGKRLTDRTGRSPYTVSWAVVSIVGQTLPSGESCCTVTAGNPPNQAVYPFIRFAETPTPLAVNDKVLLMWIGSDPHIAHKLVP